MHTIQNMIGPRTLPKVLIGLAVAGCLLVVIVLLASMTKKTAAPPFTHGRDWPTHYPPGLPGNSAYERLAGRPPTTEREFREKFHASPRQLLYVTSEQRFYSYKDGSRMYWHPETQLWYSGDPAQ